MNVEEWKKKGGERILREMGIQKGQRVLDFGCGSGTYTFIIARIVGPSGKVFALDEKKSKLRELQKKAKDRKRNNIEVIYTSGDISIPLEKRTLDVVLMYDVYHLLSERQRRKLIKKAGEILKRGGFVSYHATHLSGYGVDLSNVHEQMKEAGLKKKEKFKKQMFHWQWIEEGTVYNYYKE
jgi:ubiquinone/menaquinone biosynthesis C-methylase UbiE